jgi:hypothetical protein
MMKTLAAIVAVLAFTACGPTDRGNGNNNTGSGGADANQNNGGGDSGNGSNGNGSYLVYAHSDTVLYTIDLATSSLVTVGNFNAPPAQGGSSPDVITDLAVAPNGTIYVISNTALYTASTTDGHVTKVGSLSTCGQRGVALTTTPDGRLWMGDYMGAICEIDISGAAPVVKSPVMMQNGFALSGDIVGIGNGTIFGSAYKLSDSTTQNDNILVKVDVTTGAVTQLGPTGYPKLFGVAFQENKVFGFTHDGTGRVITIDTNTGAGTMFGTFMDPSTNHGISFAGAGVSSLIVIE